MDQSGSMTGKPMSPEARKALSEIWAKIGNKDEIKDIPPKFKNFENKIFEETVLHEKIMIEHRLFQKHILSENDTGESAGKFLKFLEKDYAEIFAEMKLSPEERAERARARGEALAEACHAGTAGATAIMRPLSLRRGFISIGEY